MIYLFDADLWLWDARQSDSWTFLSLPRDTFEEIREITGSAGKRGFGSVRVTATIGTSTWSTSIFPDAKAGAYVLPVKKVVRKAEGIRDGDNVTVRIELAAV